MQRSVALPARKSAPALAASLRIAQQLTVPILALAAAASLGGLLAPGLYRRNAAALVPALQGQDLVTLLAMPGLAAALLASRHGSARGLLMWLGLLGYLFYTYTGAALGYAFGELTLLYIALFGLAAFALAAAASGIDAPAIQRQGFDDATPYRPVAAFLLAIALLLGALELGQNIQFLRSGALPPGVAAAGGGAYFVYGLDLGLVMPLTVLAAIWLWRRLAWGLVLAGFLLIKSTAMGLALLAMNWFVLRAGQPTDAPELLGFYALLAAGGLAMTIWLFRHCKG